MRAMLLLSEDNIARPVKVLYKYNLSSPNLLNSSHRQNLLNAVPNSDLSNTPDLDYTLNRLGTYPNDVAPGTARSLGHVIPLTTSESLNDIASHPLRRHQNIAASQSRSERPDLIPHKPAITKTQNDITLASDLDNQKPIYSKLSNQAGSRGANCSHRQNLLKAVLNSDLSNTPDLDYTLNRLGTYPNDVAPGTARSLGHVIPLTTSESLNDIASHPLRRHQNIAASQSRSERPDLIPHKPAITETQNDITLSSDLDNQKPIYSKLSNQADCGRYRQSGPRPETRLLRQIALEGLMRSARTDSSRRIGRKQFSGEEGGGGGGAHGGGDGGLREERGGGF
ncbi:hypothetical protein F511_34721 [Dorcoceras hygrometricum]|uniref:Uncharacterized protein n=1 Tax=Dorcoceras hygrometricum TaxID=472368 RepID=A0A2Z7BJ59_9LAMI|nr:hypothetical protein F511_34721 [Dorcoceras hygrometricum]